MVNPFNVKTQVCMCRVNFAEDCGPESYCHPSWDTAETGSCEANPSLFPRIPQLSNRKSTEGGKGLGRCCLEGRCCSLDGVASETARAWRKILHLDGSHQLREDPVAPAAEAAPTLIDRLDRLLKR
jgi:hypothetical protein